MLLLIIATCSSEPLTELYVVVNLISQIWKKASDFFFCLLIFFVEKMLIFLDVTVLNLSESDLTK